MAPPRCYPAVVLLLRVRCMHASLPVPVRVSCAGVLCQSLVSDYFVRVFLSEYLRARHGTLMTRLARPTPLPIMIPPYAWRRAD